MILCVSCILIAYKKKPHIIGLHKVTSPLDWSRKRAEICSHYKKMRISNAFGIIGGFEFRTIWVGKGTSTNFRLKLEGNSL